MALSASGIGSNLDVNTIVTQLMAVERRPSTLLDRQEGTFRAQITAYGALKSALGSFQSSMQALSSAAKFDVLTATSSAASTVTASAAAGAIAGSYAITVNNMAQSQIRAAPGVVSTQTSSSTGTIEIRVGSGPVQTLTIDGSNNTLAGLRDAINAATAGVTATIINDGSATPYKLVLTANATGAANTIQITNNLSAGELSDTVAGLAQIRAPLDAAFTVNGVAIASASNSIASAIPGVTLNLQGSSAATITVAHDAAAVQTAVGDFVKAYNNLNTTVNGLTAYNASTKQAGLLLGDFATRNLHARVRGVLAQPLAGLGGNVTALSQIGVSFQKDGSLALDSAKLTSAINSNFSAISGLFAVQGKSDNAQLSFAGSGAASVAGIYQVDITAAATQGAVTAVNAAAGLTVIDGSNNSLELIVNGVASGVLTLAAGSYTPSQLAAALQQSLDASSAFALAGVSASAIVDGNGRIRITSADYGSGSTVADVTGTAAAALGYDGTETAAGSDVAGSYVVGNATYAATGSGRFLTGAAGTPAAGIKVEFTGSQAQVQAGNDATLNFSLGYATTLSKLATELLGTDGSIANRTAGIDRSLATIETRREALNQRLLDVEARLRKQFTALDTLISNLNKTSSFLTQQLANLPGATSSNSR